MSFVNARPELSTVAAGNLLGIASAIEGAESSMAGTGLRREIL